MRTKLGTPVATRARAHDGINLTLSKLITLLLILVIAAWAAPDVLSIVGPK